MFFVIINIYKSIIDIVINIDEKLIFHSISDHIIGMDKIIINFIFLFTNFLLCKIIILLFLKLSNKL